MARGWSPTSFISRLTTLIHLKDAWVLSIVKLMTLKKHLLGENLGILFFSFFGYRYLFYFAVCCLGKLVLVYSPSKIQLAQRGCIILKFEEHLYLTCWARHTHLASEPPWTSLVFAIVILNLCFSLEFVRWATTWPTNDFLCCLIVLFLSILSWFTSRVGLRGTDVEYTYI